MRGDQLARQWRIIRAIEASPNGLTLTEIARRERTGFRKIYRDLETLKAAGISLFTERVDRTRCWAFTGTFKFKIPPHSTLTELMSSCFYKGSHPSPEERPVSTSIHSVLSIGRRDLTRESEKPKAAQGSLGDLGSNL